MTIIRIEVARMLRNKGFLKFLMFLCFVAFLSVPGKDDHYAVILINEMTSVKNTYWLTTVPLVITNMIYVMVGFYFFRGSLNNDRLSGLLKEIHVTGIDKEKYLRLRFYALLIVQLTIALTLGIVVILLHLLKSNGDAINLGYLIQTIVYVQIPSYCVMSSVILIFEMQEMFRTKAGDMIYFFVSLIVFIMALSSPWIDLSGVSDTIQSIRTQIKVTGHDIQVFTNIRPAIEYSYQGLKISQQQWLGKIIMSSVSFIGFILMAKHYSKSDFYTSDSLEPAPLDSKLEESAMEFVSSQNSVEWQRVVNQAQVDFTMTRSSVGMGFMALIKQEWILILKNHKTACFFHLSFVALALLMRSANVSSLLLKIGFLLLMPICTEIAHKSDPGLAFDLIKTTSLGNKLRFIQLTLFFIAVLPTVTAFNLLNLTEYHLWQLVALGLSALIYSCLMQFYTTYMGKMFDLLYLLTWFVSIFQETIWVDWLYISRDTTFWTQTQISFFTATLLGMILISKRLLSPKLFKDLQ